MKKKALSIILASTLIAGTVSIPSVSVNAANLNINVSIDTALDKTPISQYIYGGNWDFNDATITAKRLGGNRMTGYNWENNFSSAGSDWQHSSDTFLLSNENVPKEQWTQPASVITTFHDRNQTKNIPYSLVTLQAAGYVSADSNGTVSEAEAAPSERWKEVKFSKGSALSLTPDTKDNNVYMDELVNFLTNKYGSAATSTGIRAYAIDNEPALWPHTHARIHSNQPTCSEILNKNVELSKVVKKLDPASEVYGPVLYGFAAYNDFQTAPDWASVKGNYRWFLDYYLDNMKKSSDSEGKRLLDVLDLHWYPEAQGGGTRITTSDTANIDCNKARLQAPRTLWDSTYKEDSWIAQWFSQFLPLLPNIKGSIDKYYPGTKLAFTEYSYGADNHITGGIAQADVLGIFGKYGVYAANIWGGGSYTASAFNLYRNFDGKGSKYGDTNVKCDTSDIANSSIYASITSSSDNKLHIMVMNKSYDSPANFNFTINSKSSYKTGSVWGFDSSSSTITQRAGITSISGNKFTYTLPALSAYHIVLEGSPTAPTVSMSGYISPDVLSSNTSIKAGFKVEIPGTTFGTATDNNGYFKIDNVPVKTSTYSIQISKSGFLARTITNISGSTSSQISTTEAPLEIWTGDIPINGKADGAINMSDIVELAKCFNSTKGTAVFNSNCDFNLDDAINMSDVVSIAKHFNATSSSYDGV
ncbi:MAG TPA: glycoside hydrolase family 44 protein [Pseudobacteroides sp.]|uniref:glycoside hydrolase family 44 protein n=1 Tax=Pseudobacteroides sp. TaxID=1968840 RepID=UPI002F946916